MQNLSQMSLQVNRLSFPGSRHERFKVQQPRGAPVPFLRRLLYQALHYAAKGLEPGAEMRQAGLPPTPVPNWILCIRSPLPQEARAEG
jgi:hypothetical protein